MSHLLRILFPAAGLAFGVLSISWTPNPGNACFREGHAAEPPTFQNCTQCHTDFAADSGDGSFQLLGIPDYWQAGQSYTLTARLADPGQQRWGFRLTVRDEAFQDAGSLNPTDGNTELCQFDGHVFLRQTGPGSRPGVADGPVDFSFQWTAPAAGTGKVAFYAVGLACDWNNHPAGDYTYTAASASLEMGDSATWSVVLQPDGALALGGQSWPVRMHVRNHATQSQTALLVSRIRWPNGQIYPPAGWLTGPTPLDLAPQSSTTVEALHAIPVGVPLIQADYEALLGQAPATLEASDVQAFLLQP